MLADWSKLLGVVVLFTASYSGQVYSYPHDNRNNDQEQPWEISALLVAGERYSPLVGNPESILNLTGAINLTYYGEHFFVDDGLGYTLFNDSHLMVNLIANSTEDFVLFNDKVFDTDIPELGGLSDRRASIDGGVEILFDGTWGEVEFQAETDLLARHNGQLVEASYAYTFNFDRFEIRPQIGFIWKSDKYVDYYYGVSSGEQMLGRPAYKGKSGFDWDAVIEAKYAITDEWNAVGWLYYELGSKGITDSPLVEKNHYREHFIGIEWVRPFSIEF